MHNAESRKLSYKIANGVIMFIMILLMLITIYPLYYTICASFSDARALLRNNDLLLKPLEPFTLDGYKAVFSNPSIVKSFGNTVFYVVVGTAISMALTIAGAFVVSRSYFLPRNVMMKGMLFTMFFGGGLIPWFFVVRDLGMYNTRWAIVIPAALSTYNLIIMRSFFLSIPSALEESALLDGANDFQVLTHIILPLSTPVLAVIGMYYAVGQWNGWYHSLIFHRTRELYPLQMILRELLILNEMTGSDSAADFVEEAFNRDLIKYCTIVVTTVPILIIYPFLQRYFVKGVMIGAIKG
ncbi:MAG: carbohydrate ABC transporter permease [Eubacteriales bacterium]|nr:carbohydrate ABC transporter permease [bacterium]MDY2791682.1 carbohydrate ABC transporter permease [Eubacteriales bacterium]